MVGADLARSIAFCALIAVVEWLQPYLWIPAVAAGAALAIWGRNTGRMTVHFVFKPLTTWIIMMVAFVSVTGSPVRTWLLIGLALSLVGDIVLMLRSRWFVLGLFSFLLGLLAYAYAFSLQLPLTPRQVVYAILPAAVSLLILISLWPHLGSMRWPSLAYMTAISLMAWRALSRFDALDVSLHAWLLGCLGASLFMLGDTLLARRRFAKKPSPYALELGSYFAAQWCLTASMAV